MLAQIDALSSASAQHVPPRQNLLQTFQLQVLRHVQVEQEAGREVAKRHQVANGLHDVPTVQVERAVEDEGKLRDADSATEPQERLGFLRSTHLIGIDLRLRLSYALQKFLAPLNHLDVLGALTLVVTL